MLEPAEEVGGLAMVSVRLERRRVVSTRLLCVLEIIFCMNAVYFV